mgnify:CR=1 FL=1
MRLFLARYDRDMSWSRPRHAPWYPMVLPR